MWFNFCFVHLNSFTAMPEAPSDIDEKPNSGKPLTTNSVSVTVSGTLCVAVKKCIISCANWDYGQSHTAGNNNSHSCFQALFRRKNNMKLWKTKTGKK